MIAFFIPVKTVNTANGPQGRSVGAHRGKARMRKQQRNAAHLAFLAATNGQRWTLEPPYIVTLRRVGAGTMDDDGLRIALKSVRDGIADSLEINDGSAAVRWVYDQRKCQRGSFSVEVEIACG